MSLALNTDVPSSGIITSREPSEGNIVCGNKDCNATKSSGWHHTKTVNDQDVRCNECYKKAWAEKQNVKGMLCGNELCYATKSIRWYYTKTGNAQDVRCNTCYHKSMAGKQNTIVGMFQACRVA